MIENQATPIGMIQESIKSGECDIYENNDQKKNRLLYFNINYDCNNDCIFCAAGSKQVREFRKEIRASTFSKILDDQDVGRGDIIVINGGEPTVHPEIVSILKDASDRGSFVYLFSNGLKLSRMDFASAVINAGVNRIAIPIYGHTAETHDFLTRHEGSFAYTMKGIMNLFLIRKRRKDSLEIELKTLVCKDNMKHVPCIVRMVVHKFPQTDYFLFSSMYISEAAFFSMYDLVPTLSRCASVIRKSIDIAIAGGLYVCLYYIPLCVLKEQKYAAICHKDRYRSDKDPDYYYDSSVPKGMRLDTDSAKGANCSRCSFNASCDGIWKSYANTFGFDDLCAMV